MYEYRFSTVDVNDRKVSGIAIRYGDVATLPWGLERFEPSSIDNLEDVVLNFQHKREKPLARSPVTMQFEDSNESLRMTAQLAETREADDVLSLIRSQVVRGLSTEFLPIKERMENGVRVIETAKLVGLAIVDKPAYPDSLVKARARALPVRTHYRKVIW